MSSTEGVYWDIIQQIAGTTVTSTSVGVNILCTLSQMNFTLRSILERVGSRLANNQSINLTRVVLDNANKRA